jgi:hypothetical protein
MLTFLGGFAKVATFVHNGCPWFQRHEFSRCFGAFQRNGLACFSSTDAQQLQLDQRAQLQRVMKRPGSRPRSVRCCCFSASVRFLFAHLRIIISRVSLCRQLSTWSVGLGPRSSRSFSPPGSPLGSVLSLLPPCWRFAPWRHTQQGGVFDLRLRGRSDQRRCLGCAPVEATHQADVSCEPFGSRNDIGSSLVRRLVTNGSGRGTTNEATKRAGDDAPVSRNNLVN